MLAVSSGRTTRLLGAARSARATGTLGGRIAQSSAQRTRSMATAMHSLADATVYCVGRNYVKHIAELPSLLDIPADIPTEPMIFIKSPGTITRGSETITLPSISKDVHHEVELAVQLGSDLKPCVAAVAIDLTARDVQAQLKRQGHPWALSKSFKGACPMGQSFPVHGVDLQQLELKLTVNGQVRQQSSTSLMIFKVADLLAYLNHNFPLQPGDWLLTGTPEGVGALSEGDTVEASVSGQDGVVLSRGAWKVISA